MKRTLNLSAMSNSDTALREFAEKWGGKIITGFGQPSGSGSIETYTATEQCLSDLTALISEHYYPKEFVAWCIIWVFEIDGKYHLRIEGKATFESMDKLYSYWDKLPAYMKKPKKENER